MLCSGLNGQIVNWQYAGNGSTPGLTHPYAVDDSNHVIHMFNYFSTASGTIFGKSVGPYTNSRNVGIVKINPDGSSDWNLVLSAPKNASSIVFSRSIATDGRDIYMVVSGSDFFLVRKNNQVSDSIQLSSGSRGITLMKVSGSGKIIWVRTLSSLNSIPSSLNITLNFDRASGRLTGALSVWDSAVIQSGSSTFVKAFSNKSAQLAKCRSLASGTFIFSYDSSGRLRRSRLIRGDVRPFSILHSFQFNCVFLNVCDTTLFDGENLNKNSSYYFSLDSTLRFRFLAEAPLGGSNTSVKFTQNGNLGVASCSYFLFSSLVDSLRIHSNRYLLKPYEVVSFNSAGNVTARRQLLPSAFTDSVRMVITFQTLNSDFIYLSGNGTNTGKRSRTFMLDGLSYTLPGSTQFSFLMKLDKLMNVLWVQFNFLPAVVPPQYNLLGNDLEGNLILNGNFNGGAAFPILNDSLKPASAAYTFVLKISDQTITRGEVSKGPYCAGDTLMIPYTVKGRYGVNNRFIAQLSDENGGFEDTGRIRELGRISTNKDSVIAGILPPLQIVSSLNYRIRIISTSPVVQSFYRLDSLRLLIFSRDKADPGPDLTICRGDTVRLNTFGGTRWKWLPVREVRDSQARTTWAQPAQTTRFTIIISDSSGCGEPDTAYKLITVRSRPQAVLSGPLAPVCTGSAISLSAAFSGGDTAGYRWSWFYVSDTGMVLLQQVSANKPADTLRTMMPAVNPDSVLFVLALSDGCYPGTDTSTVVVKINRNKPSIKTNTTDTLICPGTDVLLKAGFSVAGDSTAGFSGFWREFDNAMAVKQDSFSAVFSDSIRVSYPSTLQGIKMVQITVQSLCSEQNDTVEIRIGRLQPLEAKVNHQDTAVCFGRPVLLSATGSGGKGSGFRYRWTMQGVELSDSSSLYVRTDTTVQWLLVLTDGCMPREDSLSGSITVGKPVSIDSRISLRDTTICYGQRLPFTADLSGGDSNSYQYRWKLNNVEVSSSRDWGFVSQAQVSASATVPGFFTVMLFGQDACSAGADSLAFNIRVLPPLSLSATFSDTLCFGTEDTLHAFASGGDGQYRFEWRDHNGQATQGDKLVVAHRNKGVFGNQLSAAVLSDGCRSIEDTIMVVQYLRPALEIALTGGDPCADSVVFATAIASGGRANTRQIQWFLNRTLRAQNVGSFGFVSTGNSLLQAVAQDGCSAASDTAFMQYYYTPATDILLSDSEVCVNETVMFKVASKSANAFNKIISFGDGLTVNNSETDSLAMHRYMAPGRYVPTVISTFSNGCRDTVQSVAIRVNPKPVSDFGWFPEFPDLEDSFVNFSNRSAGAVSYQWFISGLGTTSLPAPRLQVKDTGAASATLLVISDRGCADTQTRTFRISANFRVVIPTAFTPDGDGLNDAWLPVGSGIETMELAIYTRWGELVYRGQSRIGWDGTYRNLPAPEGVYTYMARIRSIKGEVIYPRGTFILLR